ncbi:MAG: class B sortase [Clostridia bacterium]|nr:class B sortase [Clostridia bacterium]
MRKKFNIIWLLMTVVLGVVFAFSIYKIASTLHQYSVGEKTYESIAADFISFNTEESEKAPDNVPLSTDTGTASASADEPAEEVSKTPLTVDFDALLSLNPDVIGWIYCENTPINYPVLQSTDNDFYLRRMLNGKYNIAGSVFMDYRFKSDFSNICSIIYGHNMNDESMFGTFTNYKEQKYFNEHPTVWFFTPAKNYRIELIAGYVTDSSSEAYTAFSSDAELYEYVQRAIAKSTFTSSVTFTEGEKIVTLSTCSYEFSTARYVLIGKLTEQTEIDP